jgi:hypothetical protein
MTGEMSWIKSDGTDANGEQWKVHAAVAKAVRGSLRPFDAYQGPYIRIKRGQLWISSDDGFTGTVTLLRGGPVAWGGTAESIEYGPYQCIDAAIDAARVLMRQARRA